MINNSNDISDFSPSKYKKGGKSLAKRAPGTAVIKNTKGSILMSDNKGVFRATTQQQDLMLHS